jgi:hypothetical protein
MSSEIVSRVYQPDPAKCCERCVFGTGEHAKWCPVGVLEFPGKRGRRKLPPPPDDYDECA